MAVPVFALIVLAVFAGSFHRPPTKVRVPPAGTKPYYRPYGMLWSVVSLEWGNDE